MIGRDLIRLLQNVARIPEFDKLWHDLLFTPTALAPTFTGEFRVLFRLQFCSRNVVGQIFGN